MLFKDLKKSLTERVDNIYILSSLKDNEDLFIKASCINNIKSKVLTNFVDLNFNVFTNETLDAGILKKTLETLPFMEEKRLILIKESEGFKNSKVLEYLIEYCKKINPTSVLIIDCCENSYFTPIFKLDNIVLVDCSRLDHKIIESYILKTTKEKGINIDNFSMNKLIDFTDGYINNIDIELNKLINLKFEEKIITKEDVENNCVKSDEYQIYELTNSLFNKNGDRALYIVDDIVKSKKNLGVILNLIYNHVRRLFYVKITKIPLIDLAKLLELKEYAIKKLLEQAENVPAKKLKDMLILCRNTDYKIKSGELDLVSGIYNLVFSILI